MVNIFWFCFSAFAPSFAQNPLPSTMLAAVNGNITIPCRPQSAPAAKKQWLRNGGAMSVTYGDGIAQGPQLLINGDLQITRVQMLDAGLYTCQAENDKGTAQTTTELKVAGTSIMTKFV